MILFQRFLPLIGLIGFTATLTGCSIFPEPTDTVKKYVIDPASYSGSGSSESSGSSAFSRYSAAPSKKHIRLIIEAPSLYPPLDNSRIAIKPAQQQWDYLANVEWADRLSALIHDALIYSLDNCNRFKLISRSTDNAAVDYSLRVEVRKFYIEDMTATQGGTANVEYRVDLIALPDRSIKASQTILKRAKGKVDGVDALIAALNTAHTEVILELIPWIEKSLSHSKHSSKN